MRCKNALTQNHNCINSESCQNNVPITCVVQKNEKGDIISTFNSDVVEPMPMPPVVLCAPEKKEKKRTKVVNVQKKESGMPMPPVVLG